MRKISLLTLSILFLVMTALTGCSSSSSGSEGSSKNEIVFWNPFTGPDGENMKQIVNDYNKTNPKFKIKNVSMVENDMYTKIPTVVNSGKGIPDLTVVHAERIKQFVDNDMLTKFDDVLTDHPEIKAENYVTAGWDIGNLNNSRYSVPLDVHSFVMYYNKDLLEKYAPNALDDNVITFDEVKKAGELSKKDKITGIGITWTRPIFLSIYNQFGGDITSDGEAPTIDTPEAKEALQLLKSLVDDKIANKDGEDPGQLFKSGKAIFYPEGIWMQNSIKDAKKLNWGLTNFPQLSSDKIVNWTSSHQFVMFNSKERSDEKAKGIVDFLDFVRENSLPWAKAGQNPAALETLENPEYKELPQAFLIENQEMQQSLKIFDYKYNGFVVEEVDKLVGDAIYGKLDIDKGLKNAQKAVEDKISTNKK
ncbi:extracellular solute-binding protein [Pradoshia sp. D12]|uniref:extracellular solute-binding protein n=1 Tax=Bacillaceae TaxID=186817 RepID=UPI00080AECCD|nr:MULTISPECIES: extracellular solute-binding protein [Bacillaceae]OCA83406.1 sugar ABC transporter substrate-binding protein [Bacillus sp. FJAT-27986]QFK71643.1 extracellular solute-binding protein [Pradoshia sp. D12]TPF73438.1 extracellular solute-binding protein [Bacillus sp. D12]